MDQTTLVGPDLHTGLEIVAALEDARIEKITAVFVLFSDYSDWRLVLSSPSLDQDHSLKAGRKVHEILQGKFDYGLPTLMILPTHDSFISDLTEKFFHNIGPGAVLKRGKPIWFGAQTLGQRYVLDAFILSFPGVIA
jgi:hypothetical protein